MMVTLSVALILVSIGVPSFKAMIDSGRTSSQTNNLVTALNLARSEAVKRGQTVQLCSANAGETKSSCATTGWGNGWLVWLDADADDTVDSNEIIRVWPTASGAPVITVSVNIVEFEPRGELVGNAAIVFTIEPTDCSGDNSSQITINPLGQVQSVRISC